MHAGKTYNVVPDSAQLLGTIRAYDEAMREYLIRRVEEVASGVAASMRGRAVLRTMRGTPPVVNDPGVAALVESVARDTAGVADVVASEPNMGADDVAEYLKRVPGCFFMVGTRNEARGIVGDHHQPTFDVDETMLPLGVDLLVGVVDRYLAG
jgi:amidohydrolase